MDWHEALKWVGILVAAGLISTTIEMILEWKVFGPAATANARAEARAEVDRIMAAAVKQAQTRAAPEPVYVQSQKEHHADSSLVLQL